MQMTVVRVGQGWLDRLPVLTKDGLDYNKQHQNVVSLGIPMDQFSIFRSKLSSEPIDTNIQRIYQIKKAIIKRETRSGRPVPKHGRLIVLCKQWDYTKRQSISQSSHTIKQMSQNNTNQIKYRKINTNVNNIL